MEEGTRSKVHMYCDLVIMHLLHAYTLPQVLAYWATTARQLNIQHSSGIIIEVQEDGPTAHEDLPQQDPAPFHEGGCRESRAS